MAQGDPIGVVFDFDGTLTPKDASLIMVVDRACLPEPLRDANELLRQVFLKRAGVGPTTPEEEKERIGTTLEAYTDCGLMVGEWKRALNGVRLREGTAETLRKLTGRGIRVGIISFGVADFIESVLESKGLSGAVHRIYAARLICDKFSGSVLGYKTESIVHSFDKNVWSAKFAGEFDIAPDRLIAVGDSTGDRNLGLTQELRLGIARDDKEMGILAPYMGRVVVTEDFVVIDEWINEKIIHILSR